MPHRKNLKTKKSTRKAWISAVIASAMIAGLHIAYGFYERQQILDKTDVSTAFIVNGCREFIIRQSMPYQDSNQGGEIEFKN